MKKLFRRRPPQQSPVHELNPPPKPIVKTAKCLELEARPADAAGYKYACCSCGWTEPFTDTPCAEMLNAHVDECESAMRALNVPMWSVAWPYYWGVRKGEIPETHFGLEMDWRVAGSHATEEPRLLTGMSPKLWYLFARDAKWAKTRVASG
jgi:hypothetical protein